LPVRHRL